MTHKIVYFHGELELVFDQAHVRQVGHALHEHVSIAKLEGVYRLVQEVLDSLNINHLVKVVADVVQALVVHLLVELQHLDLLKALVRVLHVRHGPNAEETRTISIKTSRHLGRAILF